MAEQKDKKVSRAKESRQYVQDPDVAYGVTIPDVHLDPRVAMLGGAEKLLFGDSGPMMSLAMQQAAKAQLDVQRMQLGMPRVVAGSTREVSRTIEYDMPENDALKGQGGLSDDIYDQATMGTIKYFDGTQEVPVVKYARRKDNGLYDYIFANTSVIMDESAYNEALNAALDGYTDEKIRHNKLSDMMRELSDVLNISRKDGKAIVTTISNVKSNLSKEARIFINALYKYGVVQANPYVKNGNGRGNDILPDPDANRSNSATNDKNSSKSQKDKNIDMKPNPKVQTPPILTNPWNPNRPSGIW